MLEILIFFACILMQANSLPHRYTVDSVRRVATETILPYFMHQWESASTGEDLGTAKHGKGSTSSVKSKKSKKKSGSKSVKSNASKESRLELVNDANGGVLPHSVSKQFILDEYDNFDDFLEMVISFG